MNRACDICGNSADYANKHHDAGHAFTHAAQEVRPEDLKVGDRVRMIAVREGVVSEIDDEGYVSFGGWRFPGTPLDLGPDLLLALTWELTERPKPEAKLGSVWVDPLGHYGRFLASWHGWFVGDEGSDLDPENEAQAKVIARLVPAEEQA